MTEQMEGQMSIFDLDTWSGKMSMEVSVRQEEGTEKTTSAKTSKPSSRKSSGSSNQNLPMCLCLKSGSGANQDASTMRWEDGVLPGACTTLSSGTSLRGGNGWLLLPTSTDLRQPTFYLEVNFGEKPTEEMQTRLSDVLEERADERYYLSPRACQGILNRAARRGKNLPEILKTALENQIARGERDPEN